MRIFVCIDVIPYVFERAILEKSVIYLPVVENETPEPEEYEHQQQTPIADFTTRTIVLCLFIVQWQIEEKQQ